MTKLLIDLKGCFEDNFNHKKIEKFILPAFKMTLKAGVDNSMMNLVRVDEIHWWKKTIDFYKEKWMFFVVVCKKDYEYKFFYEKKIDYHVWWICFQEQQQQQKAVRWWWW